MNISEWCKLKRDNANLSEEEFAIKAWNYQKQKVRDMIMQQEEERFEKRAEQKIEQEVDKNIDRAIERALKSGFSKMDIKISL